MSYLVQAKTTRQSMGLETMGQCLFDGATTTVTPAVIQGKVIHGLTRQDDIKAVEGFYGKTFKDHVDFYASLVLEVPHTLSVLNRESGEDILKLGVLSAQGKLAPSIDEQDDPNAFYQFVERDDDKVAATDATLFSKRIDAYSYLKQIKDKEPDYMLALCHYICNFNSGVKKPDQAFKKLGEYIDGKITGDGKKNEAVNYFLRILDPAYGGEKPKEEVFVRVDVERAKSLHIIRFDRTRGVWYNAAIAGSDYGTRIEDVVEFLLAITNADHLGGGPKDAEYSIRKQIAKAEAGNNFK
jgi:hypothetical protein